MGRKFIFTNKNESKKGIMSTVFGLIASVSICMAVYLTFQMHGAAPVKYGVVGLLSMILAIAGLTLGIMAKLEQDRFYFFAWLGIILNGLALLGIAYIIYAGVYGV